jgi:hypothetical protein
LSFFSEFLLDEERNEDKKFEYKRKNKRREIRLPFCKGKTIVLT